MGNGTNPIGRTRCQGGALVAKPKDALHWGRACRQGDTSVAKGTLPMGPDGCARSSVGAFHLLTAAD